ncbi:MAG: hypothetical protein CSB55_08135 [Candidatus Cloacimonadota bacterium]|nr:MAG: hypothetical protein CSB55_08135 [Candidatus Cloacimonadota bacterium]
MFYLLYKNYRHINIYFKYNNLTTFFILLYRQKNETRKTPDGIKTYEISAIMLNFSNSLRSTGEKFLTLDLDISETLFL